MEALDAGEAGNALHHARRLVAALEEEVAGAPATRLDCPRDHGELDATMDLGTGPLCPACLAALLRSCAAVPHQG